MAVLNLVLFGAQMAIEVTDNQPQKLAAMEGVWNDESCAPLFIVGWVNESEQTTKGISVPCMLSFLAYQDFDATVQGLNSFPEDTWAPVNLTFQVYHIMFDLAMVFAAVGVIGAVLYYWKQKLFQWRWMLWVPVVTVVFTEIAIIAGWWTAEVGRQPWIVWELMKTEDGVSSNLTSSMLWASIGMFVVLYTLLFALFIFLLNNKIQTGPARLEEMEEVPVTTLPDTFREIFRRRGARASGQGELPAETGEVRL
jgi:cytochrome d ubiquinol oxidase subunit I